MDIDKRIPINNIDIIKDMYDKVVANFRICGTLTNDFFITAGLNQVSMLSPLLFVIMMDEFTRVI